jgi:hypothetical protein
VTVARSRKGIHDVVGVVRTQLDALGEQLDELDGFDLDAWSVMSGSVVLGVVGAYLEDAGRRVERMLEGFRLGVEVPADGDVDP